MPHAAWSLLGTACWLLPAPATAQTWFGGFANGKGTIDLGFEGFRVYKRSFGGDDVAYVSQGEGGAGSLHMYTIDAATIDLHDQIDLSRAVGIYELSAPKGGGVGDTCLVACDGATGLLIGDIKAPDVPFSNDHFALSAVVSTAATKVEGTASNAYVVAGTLGGDWFVSVWAVLNDCGTALQLEQQQFCAGGNLTDIYIDRLASATLYVGCSFATSASVIACPADPYNWPGCVTTAGVPVHHTIVGGSLAADSDSVVLVSHEGFDIYSLDMSVHVASLPAAFTGLETVTSAANLNSLRGVFYACHRDGVSRVEVRPGPGSAGSRWLPYIATVTHTMGGAYAKCHHMIQYSRNLLVLHGTSLTRVARLENPESVAESVASPARTTTAATTTITTTTATAATAAPTETSAASTSSPGALVSTAPTSSSSGAPASSISDRTTDTEVFVGTETRDDDTGAVHEGISPSPPTPPRPRNAETAAADTGSSVAGVSAVIGGTAGPAALRLAALAVACDPQRSRADTDALRYTLVMAPIPWKVAGSRAAGALVGNLLLAAAAAVLGWLLSMAVQPLRQRVAPAFAAELDAQGLTMFPSAPLIAFVFLYQGTTLAAAELVLDSEGAGLAILGCAGVCVCIAVPGAVLWAVVVGTPQHSHVEPDPVAASPLAVFLLGQGEWASKQRSVHWVSRWSSAVRPYRQGAVWYGALEAGMTFCVSVTIAAPVKDAQGCAAAKIAVAVLYGALFGTITLCTPHLAGRNVVLDALLALGQFCAAAVYAVAYLAEDTSRLRFAEALVYACVGLVIAKVAADLLVWVFVFASGRRRRLQDEVWGREGGGEAGSGSMFEMNTNDDHFVSLTTVCTDAMQPTAFPASSAALSLNKCVSLVEPPFRRSGTSGAATPTGCWTFASSAKSTAALPHPLRNNGGSGSTALSPRMLPTYLLSPHNRAHPSSVVTAL